MKLLIYIPALNEEKSIKNVIDNLPKQIDGISSIEVLVIDDGSEDDTAKIAKDTGVHLISHGNNRGLGTAFQTGVQFSLDNGIDILVGIDADGQFNANDIPKLIEPILKKQIYMVTGNRFSNGKPSNMSTIKYSGNQWVAKIINKLTGSKLSDVSCGYRAYSREALCNLSLFGTFSYTHEVILKLVFNEFPVTEVPISVKYFTERKSRIASSIPNYAIRTSMIIFRTLLDYRPIRVFGTLGGINLLIALVFIGALFTHYLFNGAFTPYKSFGFIGLGFAIFGILLFIFGLLADMINRVRVNQDKILYKLNKQTRKKKIK
jgi:glycosyltransferase involved in cell wall biosynthesis